LSLLPCTAEKVEVRGPDLAEWEDGRILGKSEYPDDPVAAEGWAVGNAYTMTMIGYPEEKKREAFLGMGFDKKYASMLAKLDAVIFLNQRKMLDFKTRLGQQEVNELITLGFERSRVAARQESAYQDHDHDRTDKIITRRQVTPATLRGAERNEVLLVL
jgi:hypothetical protein